MGRARAQPEQTMYAKEYYKREAADALLDVRRELALRCGVVDELERTTRVDYVEETNLLPGHLPRNMVLVATVQRDLHARMFVIAYRSVIHKKVKVEGQFIRAHVFKGESLTGRGAGRQGFIVREVDERSSELTYVIQMDVKGVLSRVTAEHYFARRMLAPQQAGFPVPLLSSSPLFLSAAPLPALQIGYALRIEYLSNCGKWIKGGLFPPRSLVSESRHIQGALKKIRGMKSLVSFLPGSSSGQPSPTAPRRSSRGPRPAPPHEGAEAPGGRPAGAVAGPPESAQPSRKAARLAAPQPLDVAGDRSPSPSLLPVAVAAAAGAARRPQRSRRKGRAGGRAEGPAVPGPGKAAPSIGSAASLEAAPAPDAAGLLATLKPRPALPPAAGAGAGAGAGSSLAAAAGAAVPRPSTTAAAASASPPPPPPSRALARLLQLAAAGPAAALDERWPRRLEPPPPGAVIAGIRSAGVDGGEPAAHLLRHLPRIHRPPQPAPNGAGGPPKRPSGLSALQALLDASPVVFDAEELAREERRLRRRRRLARQAAAEARADAERVATPAALQQLQLQHSATAPGALAPGLAGRSDGSPLRQSAGGGGGAGGWSEESSSGSSAEEAAANSAQEEDEAEEERMREEDPLNLTGWANARQAKKARHRGAGAGPAAPGQEGRAAAAAAAKGPLKSGGVGARLFRKYMATAAGRVRVSTPLDPVHQAALDFANARAEARRLRHEAGVSAYVPRRGTGGRPRRTGTPLLRVGRGRRRSSILAPAGSEPPLAGAGAGPGPHGRGPGHLSVAQSAPSLGGLGLRSGARPATVPAEPARPHLGLPPGAA
eukprot:tig00000532_g1879.t1